MIDSDVQCSRNPSEAKGASLGSPHLDPLIAGHPER
jgi:hypothetical protein